jgi:hypothetical protein
MSTPNPHAAIFEAYAKDMSTKIELETEDGNWLSSDIGSVLLYPHNTYRIKPKFLSICGYQATAPVEHGEFEVVLKLANDGGYIGSVVYAHATLVDATTHFNLLVQASIPE